MKSFFKMSFTLVACLSICVVFVACSATTTDPSVEVDIVPVDDTAVVEATVTPEPTATPEPTPIVTTVTFSASGDNLIHKSIYEDAATAAAEAGNGDAYDFTYVYENVASFFADYDVNWINQETLVTDTLEPSTYPTFSTPGEIVDTLYDIGFCVFSISNNHTYDKGATGIDATLDFWESQPDDVISVGLYDDATDENDIELQEVNGITIAYVAYTFSTNGISTPSNATKTVIYTTETERIQAQVTLADSLADVVVVSVHWGAEDSHTIHTSQETLAQDLADWGADLIIGTHPHVLQDGEWLTAEDGSTAFVVYSLGNFVSAQSKADNLIGGILTLTFQKTIELDGSVTVELIDPQITPVVTHYDVPYEYPRVYLWSDYTEEMLALHGVRNYDSRFTYDYIEQVITENISPEFLAGD